MGEEHAGHEGSKCKHPDVKVHLTKSEEEQDAQQGRNQGESDYRR